MSTIPVQDLPREQTLFNHLIDELERCSIMAHKVQKAREAPLYSHRRTTNWLWEKVELVLQLTNNVRIVLSLINNLSSNLRRDIGTMNPKVAGAPNQCPPSPRLTNAPRSPHMSLVPRSNLKRLNGLFNGEASDLPMSLSPPLTNVPKCPVKP